MRTAQLNRDHGSRPVRIRLIGAVVFTGWLLAGAGCTHATIGETGAGIRPGDEGVVIIQGRTPAAESVSDTAFVDCVNKNLAEALPRPLAIYKTQAFLDSMFPWFEPGHAPSTTEELQALLARPEVSQQIQSLHVRFIVTIAGGTESNTFPGMLCSYGCFGLYASRHITRIAAVVLDVESRAPAQEVKAESGGHTIIPAFILPIPLSVAQTESKACDDVSNRVETFLIERVHSASQ